MCRLLHALYGLKQAGREWYFHFHDTMLELGFSHCQTEHVVFYHYKNKDVLIVAVDIDDLTMAGNTQAITTFKQQLSSKFKIKDLGELRWLVGIKVKRDCDHSMCVLIKSYKGLAYTMQSHCPAR